MEFEQQESKLLINDYCPKTLNDIIGQDNIVDLINSYNKWNILNDPNKPDIFFIKNASTTSCLYYDIDTYKYRIRENNYKDNNNFNYKDQELDETKFHFTFIKAS